MHICKLTYRHKFLVYVAHYVGVCSIYGNFREFFVGGGGKFCVVRNGIPVALLLVHCPLQQWGLHPAGCSAIIYQWRIQEASEYRFKIGDFALTGPDRPKISGHRRPPNILLVTKLG